VTTPTRAYAYYVVGLLTAVNFFNYVDRLVMQSMFDDLRARFQFTDTEFGAFWFAFFLVHALATFPLGWASDHFDRRKIMGLGIIIWSLATLGSAYAWGFVSMLLLRGAIGVGEAAYGPPANALLCEIFPDKKARVVAIFNGGMFAGACVGLAIGAFLGFPTAFQVVAIPGLILGFLVLILDVPPERVAPEQRPSLRTMLRDGWRSMKIPTLRWMLVSGILISFAAGGYIVWIIDFTVHHKMVSWGMDRITVTTYYFVITLVCGVAGVVTAGFLADRLMRRTRAGRTLTIAIGFLAAVPFAIGVVFIEDKWPFFACGAVLLFFLPWYNGPMAAVIDDVVEDRDAGTAQATFVLLLHVVGTGPAGFILGVISSYSNLRYAFLLPAFAILGAAICALLAARHVDADMRAKERRQALPEG
jgi:predicted MFS family arabinose efflux permease